MKMLAFTEAMAYISKEHSEQSVFPSTFLTPISFMVHNDFISYYTKIISNDPYIYSNRWLSLSLIISFGDMILDKIYIGSSFKFALSRGKSNGILTKINKIYIFNSDLNYINKSYKDKQIFKNNINKFDDIVYINDNEELEKYDNNLLLTKPKYNNRNNRQVAANLLDYGMSIDKIIDITELPKDEVVALSKRINRKYNLKKKGGIIVKDSTLRIKILKQIKEKKYADININDKETTDQINYLYRNDYITKPIYQDGVPVIMALVKITDKGDKYLVENR